MSGVHGGVNTIDDETSSTLVELGDELLDLLGDLRADRAAGRGERERDVDVAALDLDPVDEAELDEVEPELGIDDVGEGVLDVFGGGHGLSVATAFV